MLGGVMDWVVATGLICETVALVLCLVFIVFQHRRLKLLSDAQDELNKKWHDLFADLAKSIHERDK
jgi:hypothetical protein